MLTKKEGMQWSPVEVCVCDCAGVKPAAGLLNPHPPPHTSPVTHNDRQVRQWAHTHSLTSTTSAQLLRCVLLKRHKGTVHWTCATLSVRDKKKKLFMWSKGSATQTNPEIGLHCGGRKLVASPPTFSHLDSARGNDQRAYLNSPVALPCCCQSALRLRHCRLPHCLDLLVTRYCAELEGWLTKTAQQREGKNSLRTK